jgi:maltose O-acetyltransferase
MSKTYKSKLKFIIQKTFLAFKDVIAHHDSYFNDVAFTGSAEIEPFTRIIGVPQITIGDNFYINCNCHLLGNIQIGSNVMIGPQTIIWSRDHGIKKNMNMSDQSHVNDKVIIGDDVWIGANVTILKGVNIGKGVVIGAGSVVTKSIPDYSIAVGNPVKIIKQRHE